MSPRPRALVAANIWMMVAGGELPSVQREQPDETRWQGGFVATLTCLRELIFPRLLYWGYSGSPSLQTRKGCATFKAERFGDSAANEPLFM